MLETEPQASSTRARVLACFDGSPGSVAAIEWSSQEAAARGVPLRVITCSVVPALVDFYDFGTRQIEGLTGAVTRLKARHPNLTVESSTTGLDPRNALIDEAASADLLVLGAAEQGTTKGLLQGSVTRTAVRRSPCPVVVVRGRRIGPVRHIVVGVDGSNAAAAALDLACDEANVHGADLSVVHAWERDVTRAEARCILDLAVNESRDRIGGEVRGILAEATPSKALIEASRHADLVAIGSRGRSGFKTILFGSVALDVAEDADCPVAVTHPRIRTD